MCNKSNNHYQEFLFLFYQINLNENIFKTPISSSRLYNVPDSK